MTLANTVEIYGYYGHLFVELTHGLVIARERWDGRGIPIEDGDESRCSPYDVIAKFDLDEYRASYPDEQLDGALLPIEQIGCWTVDGGYQFAPTPSTRVSLANKPRARSVTDPFA